MANRSMLYSYCPYCAQEMAPWLDAGQMRKRCQACGYVHYRNPTVGVAVIILREEQILLGRRAPGVSYARSWCIPCGHVEWDEEVRDAAARELVEETGLVVSVGDVFSIHSNFHNPHQHTVGIWFWGHVVGGRLRPGDDLDRLAYYPLSSPPPLAFPTDAKVLKQLQRYRTTGGPI